MLFDPKWEKQTKADPFALESLIEWLEKQSGRMRYNYRCNGHCLLARYLTDCGFRGVNVGGHDFAHDDSADRVDLPDPFNEIAVNEPYTFGAALKRARASLLAE